MGRRPGSCGDKSGPEDGWWPAAGNGPVLVQRERRRVADPPGATCPRRQTYRHLLPRSPENATPIAHRTWVEIPGGMCRTVRLAVKGWFGERKRGAAVRLAPCAARRRRAASAAIAGRSSCQAGMIRHGAAGGKRGGGGERARSVAQTRAVASIQAPASRVDVDPARGIMAAARPSRATSPHHGVAAPAAPLASPTSTRNAATAAANIVITTIPITPSRITTHSALSFGRFSPDWMPTYVRKSW